MNGCTDFNIKRGDKILSETSETRWGKIISTKTPPFSALAHTQSRALVLIYNKF